jgi:hypothetical protein
MAVYSNYMVTQRRQRRGQLHFVRSKVLFNLSLLQLNGWIKEPSITAAGLASERTTERITKKLLWARSALH